MATPAKKAPAVRRRGGKVELAPDVRRAIAQTVANAIGVMVNSETVQDEVKRAVSREVERATDRCFPRDTADAPVGRFVNAGNVDGCDPYVGDKAREVGSIETACKRLTSLIVITNNTRERVNHAASRVFGSTGTSPEAASETKRSAPSGEVHQLFELVEALERNLVQLESEATYLCKQL